MIFTSEKNEPKKGVCINCALSPNDIPLTQNCKYLSKRIFDVYELKSKEVLFSELNV